MDSILILDYGSQYTQLIARRIREQHVYSEIVPFDISAEKVRELSKLYLELGRAFCDLLALHTDNSLWESYLRLDAIEKIVNPEFEHVLIDNASCG